MIKPCLNEFDYIRKNLRRHGEEYSLDSLIEYYKKTDALFAEASDALIEEIIEINKEEDYYSKLAIDRGIQKSLGVFNSSIRVFKK